jgi:dUTP pyrophosphatase
MFTDSTQNNEEHTVEVILKNDDAILPTKGTSLSVGYDLTCISVHKKLSNKTTLYDTGVTVNPPPGYYTEIIPRSSLSKTGYILSNSIGVIDPDYRGNLLVALTKIDDDVQDIELPFNKVQLVLKKYENYKISQVFELNETERGDGAFGSTDFKCA